MLIVAWVMSNCARSPDLHQATTLMHALHSPSTMLLRFYSQHALPIMLSDRFVRSTVTVKQCQLYSRNPEAPMHSVSSQQEVLSSTFHVIAPSDAR